MFDETYIHWAENSTDQMRLILFCDVERPLTSRLLMRFNHWYKYTFVRATQTENMPGDKVGWMNRMFGVAYYLRLPGEGDEAPQQDAVLHDEVGARRRARLSHILRLKPRRGAARLTNGGTAWALGSS